jgi:hypothetical protein
MKNHRVGDVQRVAPFSPFAIDQEESVADRVVDLPPREMRQTTTRKSVEANLLLSRWNGPRPTKNACDLIRHWTYRTIIRNPINPHTPWHPIVTASLLPAAKELAFGR